MKKIIAVLIILIFISGCVPKQGGEQPPKTAKTDFSRGVWLSFSEIDRLCNSKQGFRAEFDVVAENLKTMEITDLYFHVRSHCDSVVKSVYFPKRESSKNADCDILQYAIEKCHAQNIRLHAWINPYRVDAARTDTENLPSDSLVAGWIAQKSENVIIHNGIYLNPASRECRRLVLDGIKEIADSYSVDGIHFDDYFYPTTSAEFDKATYEKYKASAETPLSLGDWRRANVDILIADCKTLLESQGKGLVFSVSPAADIDKNYNNYYADIKTWVERGYVDEIIPQLYFGFEHTQSEFCFPHLLKRWKELAQKNPSVKLTVGLAAYKVGTQSATDGTEWQENADILLRQEKICREDKAVDGVVFFSYKDCQENGVIGHYNGGK